MSAEVQDAAPSDDDSQQIITNLRWHISRFDTLRGQIASRASFVISADTVLIGGVALLFPQAIGGNVLGGKPSIGALALAAMAVLTLAVSSVVAATRVLVSATAWRSLYGTQPPPGMLYSNSDTLRAAPTFDAFRNMVMEPAMAQEHESAAVGLWIVLNTYNLRYRYLRRATMLLQLSLLTFAASVMAAVSLSSLGLLLP